MIGEGPFPTLLLIAGSGIEDMDASICSFGSAEPLSQNFRLIAEELPRHGFAVLRYSKHYVTGPCQVDFMQYYTRVDLPLLLQDAGQLLAAAHSNELVDVERLYLYGWSKGSTIAASLAISHSDAIAGLVLQAPVTLAWYDTFLYQFADVQLPFVRELAVEGKIAPESLLELVNGHAGLLAMGGLTYLADPACRYIVPGRKRNADQSSSMATWRTGRQPWACTTGQRLSRLTSNLRLLLPLG